MEFAAPPTTDWAASSTTDWKSGASHALVAETSLGGPESPTVFSRHRKGTSKLSTISAKEPLEPTVTSVSNPARLSLTSIEIIPEPLLPNVQSDTTGDNSEVNEGTITAEVTTLQTDTLSKDHELWLPDGNVVLVARGYAFKVHQSILSRHSEFFEMLFTVPQRQIQSD
ncbi:hypothetical protein WOLCODRAFT_164232 [Wolfiporia cocos MD-104 SS10]|uniref:BTB domain-containing protein n=1 Tax=Wolfiporia cocos (strain MD-104) TaxID=742152 RepID=A0A2H3JMI7_WOLCO|nr:hypothetical protein WOLCODRAFT_164232 [Wolfiporia cocos MD-104 SS10]